MQLSGFNDEPLPPGLREFHDADATRKLVYDNALTALQKRFPLSDGKRRLELHDVRYDGPLDYSLADQKRALMTDRSVRTPVKGTWKLYDEETGQQLEEREDTVMHIPYYTPRGTIIHHGNEYTVGNQSRLKPGVYTRTRKSGEHEAQFNIAQGTGTGFRLWLEPATGIMRVNVGQSNIPAYQFMNALGIPDADMEKTWGSELMEVNMKKQDVRALDKLYTKFLGSKADRSIPEDEKKKLIQETVGKMELDPWVMERTMGMPDVKAVTPAVLLRATQKLLNVNRGHEQEDDRDNPQYSNVHSIEDFMAERIDKDAGRTAKNLLFKTRRRGLAAIGRAALNPYVESFLYGSGLAQPLAETNPISIFDQTNKLTKMGEGGLGSTEAITDEARDVNPGQLGFIDLVSSSESEKIGVETQLAHKTYKGIDKQIYAEFLDARTGKIKHLKPEDTAGKVIGFPGQDNAAELHAMKDGRMIEVPREEVDYLLPSQPHMLNPTLNMTPMMTGFMPGRAFFASKYWGQFLPVVEGEPPLVKTEVPGTGKSFSEYYGRKVAAINSKYNGEITRVTDNGITISTPDGEKHIVETVKDFPFNRMTAISYHPTVKTGDVVKEGDLIAHSNFTDRKGEFTLGRNLKTMVAPMRGHSFEDAYTISQSAAEKLKSEQLYGFDVAQRNGVKVSRNSYISSFPKKFGNDQLEKLDEDGIVKPGMIVNQGDPLILATGPRVLSAQDAQLGRLHKVLRNTFKDESVVWEMANPGVVTDVAMTAKGAKVNVKSIRSVQVGDKLTSQGSSKGVVGKIIPDEEMPRDVEGKPYEMVFNPMAVLSRIAPNQIAEMKLAKIAKKTGKPYLIPSIAPDEGWNRFAEAEMKKHDVKDAEDVYDPKTGKTIKAVGDGYMYISPFHHLAEKKLCVSMDTEFETERGWVKAGDLKPDDKLHTLDQTTGAIGWEPMSALNYYDMRGGQMYHIETDDQDLVVTPDHRVMADQTKVKLTRAEDLYHLVMRKLI